MPVSHEDLIERSAELKQAMLVLARGRRYAQAMRAARQARLGSRPTVSQQDEINFLDYFLLQYRQRDGRRLVEHFVAAHPDLPAEERAMLLGWTDVVDGLFEVVQRDGEALIARNLIDDLAYRIRANAGPATFSNMRPGSFLISRLVPVNDEWLMSGMSAFYGSVDRDTMLEITAAHAMRSAAAVFRNPESLRKGWEMQREERRYFVAFFGTDLLVLPGSDLDERIQAFDEYRYSEARGSDGKTVKERVQASSRPAPPRARTVLPDDLLSAETVGVIYDEIDGLNFYPEFGQLAAIFADPALAADRENRDLVLNYLHEPGIAPLPLRRLAERDPARASCVFQQVLKQPNFLWERDGEALLRRSKADYYATPVLPGVTPLRDELARALERAKRPGTASGRGTASAGPTSAIPTVRRPGRNDPCPCGSGRKYKHCCGR